MVENEIGAYFFFILRLGTKLSILIIIIIIRAVLKIIMVRNYCNRLFLIINFSTDIFQVYLPIQEYSSREKID